jgi:3,4-dehydroadipyl-CoA semialdehyde dehydrogenase
MPSNAKSPKLSNYLSGQWQEGKDDGVALFDPVTGEELRRASSTGLNIGGALNWARTEGGKNLLAMGYSARAEMVGKIADVLNANKDKYYEISQKNLGATLGDNAFDIDGGIFTLKSYARAGKNLGSGAFLKEGAVIPLSKENKFEGQHYLMPMRGVAVFINAFNFPSWGLWEKAGPALLSGMPVFVKPATPTAWLTQEMVADVIAAGVVPAGALSIVCGGARDLLDHVNENDVVSFTGSADTARTIKSHPAVIGNAVRVNIEADSVNAAILGPDATPGTPEFDFAVKEIVREMTVKAGQKCTAIRRIIVSKQNADALGQAIVAKLSTTKVGNPRNEATRMGPLVSKAQQQSAIEGIALLKTECKVLIGDAPLNLIDATADQACFIAPTLLRCDLGVNAKVANDVEVFGPVATLIPYENTADAIAIARRGRGSLVASVFSGDENFCQELIPAIADLHGRIMVVDAKVEGQQTGHGNVMPNCLHGGPGKAGGGEELGGLRALTLYHRRMVVQAGPHRTSALSSLANDAAPLFN